MHPKTSQKPNKNLPLKDSIYFLKCRVVYIYVFSIQFVYMYSYIYICICVHYTYIYTLWMYVNYILQKSTFFFQPETSGWSTVNCCFPIHCPMVSTAFEAKPLSFTWLWSGCHNNMMREDDASLIILQSLLQVVLGSRFWVPQHRTSQGIWSTREWWWNCTFPKFVGCEKRLPVGVFDVFFCSPKKGLLRGNDRHSTTKAFAKPNFPGEFLNGVGVECFIEAWWEILHGFKTWLFHVISRRMKNNASCQGNMAKGLIDELFGFWLCFRFTINVVFLFWKKAVDNIAHKYPIGSIHH